MKASMGLDNIILGPEYPIFFYSGSIVRRKTVYITFVAGGLIRKKSTIFNSFMCIVF